MNDLHIGNFIIEGDRLVAYGRMAFIALLILLATWVLAKAAKWGFAKLVETVPLLRRETSTGESFGLSLGRIVSLLIWLLGLIAILNVLNLGSVTGPMEAMLAKAMGFIPNIVGAGLILFIGHMLARIAKELVETVLSTVDFDRWANRGGVDQVTGNSSISRTIGTIVYVLIIIPVVIGALQALQIEAISGPLVAMLTRILDAVPNIIGASIVLGLGFVIARWIASLVQELVAGLGADQSVAAIGLLPATIKVSAVANKIVMVTVLLVTAIAATRLLDFPELTAVVDEVLRLGGAVLFGGVIIAVGFLVANFLASLIGGAGGDTLGTRMIRYATILLFSAMGLKYMGIADSIIEMAFGALVIGAAAAAALAFGLGGRDAAARVLDDMRGKPADPPSARRTAPPPAE
ncbi:MAG: mechanosensitive ion channel [Sphingopyxis sp.]|uniref:mechanosensitive ion channel n=1 Tax=Sphingopyxis sp. TaxID=1908224 RepID=UPI0032EF1810